MATSTSSPLWLLVKLYFMITILQYFTFMLAKSDTYIIHMDITAMPKAFSDHHSWYAATLSSATTSSSLNLIYTYTNVIHGFSASLSPYELEILEKSPGFISSIPDLPVKVHTTRTSQFLNLNSVSGAWPESNYGNDVIIGMIDTGIWPESRSFNDDGFTEIPSRWKGECGNYGIAFNSSMCNKKLIGAKVFYKGAVSNNANLANSVYSPRDMDGHGTHTSSTAAGNYVDGASYFGYASGIAAGMAPKARVAVYKVVWDRFNSFTSDVLAALDQAIEDGVDVLSISLGLDPIPLYNDPVAIATFAAMEKGIFVSSSAGNEGPDYGVVHNAIPWVVTVSAGTIDREFSGIITLSNGVSVAGSSLYPINSSHIIQLPLIFMNNCLNPKELKKVGRKIVVCLIHTDWLYEQIDNVNKGNAAGGIFISNTSSFDSYIQTSFPAVFLSPQDGQKVIDFLNMSSDPRAILEFQKITCVGKTKIAPRVDDYSSRGPSQTCPNILKPDIMAPGTLVLASWPKFNPVTEIGSRHLLSDFNILSGTSMACPHVSGIGALIKGIHPDWSPAAIRSAMMTTADILDNTNSPIMEIGYGLHPASPLAMGAGHVNPNKAIDPGLIYDANVEDYVNFLCSMNFTPQQIQTITRSKSHTCLNPSPDLNYPSFIAYFNANDSTPECTIVREFTRTVTNVGEGMATYIAVLMGAMDEFQVSVEPGVLLFKEKHEKQSYKLTIKGPKLMKEIMVHGFVAWMEIGGSQHVVRSPIVATRLSPETLSG